MNKYEVMSTDELLEQLPANLHIARNENAPEHDRWRVYNSATSKYITPGYSTAHALLVGTLTNIDQRFNDG